MWYNGNMITVYVDESGNLGRGGDFFVFGAVIYRDAKGSQRLSRMIKKERLRLSTTDTPIDEIKSNKLLFEDRQRILNKIMFKPDNDIFYLVAHKKHLKLLQISIKDKTNLTYNYLAGMLLTAIARKYNDDIRVIFDQRSTKVTSMDSLKDYARIKVLSDPNFLHSIEFIQLDSKNDHGLQVADIISGTVYKAYENKKPHFLSVINGHVVGRIRFPQHKF